MKPLFLGRLGLIVLLSLALPPAASLADPAQSTPEPAAPPASAALVPDGLPPEKAQIGSAAEARAEAAAEAAPATEAAAAPAAEAAVAPAAEAEAAVAPAAEAEAAVAPAAEAAVAADDEAAVAAAADAAAVETTAEPAAEASAEAQAEPVAEIEGTAKAESATGGAEGEGDPKHRYSADIDDAELERRWKEDPSGLGPLSIGFANAGRLVNGLPFPEGPRWIVLDPGRHYGTQELIDGVSRAIEQVNEVFPDSPRLGVGHISKRDGGWLRPHISHQFGLDVDLVFYYEAKRGKRGERIFDVPRNWALLRALITEGDVHFVLVDRRLIRKLHAHALSIGEDKDWLDSIFWNGRNSLVFHAPRHRDHFHVRYYSGRAQELGRRVQPLLAQGPPEHNVAIYRVRRGDTLGSIALKYETTVSRIRKANGLHGHLIRAGRTLQIPLGTACTRCPVPPEVIVPPRRLPPSRPSAVAPDPATAPGAEPAIAGSSERPPAELRQVGLRDPWSRLGHRPLVREAAGRAPAADLPPPGARLSEVLQ